MNEQIKNIGIVTKTIEKQFEEGFYLTAWIKTPDDIDLFFHQNSLINRHEIKQIADGRFIFFDKTITTTKIGERQDAINCTLNCEKEIIRNIIQYDLDAIKFIFKHASPELINKLVYKIETIQSKTQTDEILKKIAYIKTDLADFFPQNELQKNEHNTELLENESKPSKTFLQTIFETNTPEYNQNLFQILVDGIKVIDSEDVFQQAILLLNFNKSKADNKIENLNLIFYQKATDEYKFRLWFDKLIDFCSTKILNNYFNNATIEFKTKIIERCEGTENGFLVLNNNVKNTDDVEEVYFSGIREILIKELCEAQKSIFVAVAWFTNDELFNILCSKLENKVRVELIIINDYINNWEFGLPFQKFVDLGGKLFLSEYPSIMHNKFCLIDNETIFNGSYNWTYFAEMHNDENVMLFKGKPNLMKAFKSEFKKLKAKLGNPIETVIPFDSSQIVRFERNAFRQYFSTDLTLRAKNSQKRNDIIQTSKLLSSAILLDDENIKAKTIQQEIQSDVQLLQYKNTFDKVLLEKTHTIFAENSEIIEPKIKTANECDIISQTVEIEPKTKNIQNSVVQNNIASEKHSEPIIKTENTNINTSQNKNNLSSVKHSFTTNNSHNVKSHVGSVTPVTKNIDTVQNIKDYTSTIYENPSKKIFQHLNIAIALDISGSMDNLYKNGTVQQVVEKLLAISLSISSKEQLDIWTFNDNAKRLNSVSRHNFHNYITNNAISTSGGTKVASVLIDIDKKYFIENTGNNVFAIILTDGDIGELQTLITNSSTKPIFWQFVGLGNDFAKLNTLNGANKNVSFFSLNDISTISNDVLYNKLLNEFPNWYAESDAKGILNKDEITNAQHGT